MKYLKLDINITKEQCKLIDDKFKSWGCKQRGTKYDFHISLKSIKKGYPYVWRSSAGVSHFLVPPFRFNKKIMDSEYYGEEITIEEFLKL